MSDRWAKGRCLARNATLSKTTGSASPVASSAPCGHKIYGGVVETAVRLRTLKRISILCQTWPVSRLGTLIEALRKAAARHSTQVDVHRVESRQRLLVRLQSVLSGRVRQERAAQPPTSTDEAHAPLILEVFIYLLVAKCLVPLSDGLAGYYLPSLQHPRGPKTNNGFNQVRACTKPTLPTTLPETEPARPGYELCALAERRLARASCGPFLPPYHKPFRFYLW
jgi:hypothetical protein